MPPDALDTAMTAWEAPSRFGPAGLLARRLLHRVLRPALVRGREIDAHLAGRLAAVEGRHAELERRLAALAAPLAAPAHAPAQGWGGEGLAPGALTAVTIEPDEVLDAPTDVGPLFVHRGDPVFSEVLYRNGSWEGDLTALLSRELRPGMTVLDVGANIGYFSVLASRLVGASGRVIAVEPLAENLRLLRANLARNRCWNAVVLPMAALDRHDYLPMRWEGSPAGAQLLETAPDTPLVPCVPLDELLAGQAIDFVKVDCEGNDHLAILGLRSTLAANPAAEVVCEQWLGDNLGAGLPIGDRRCASTEEVLALYRSLGFTVNILMRGGEELPATLDRVFRAPDIDDLVTLVLRRR